LSGDYGFVFKEGDNRELTIDTKKVLLNFPVQGSAFIGSLLSRARSILSSTSVHVRPV